MNKFDPELTFALREWLGSDGLEFFGSLYAEHGTLIVSIPGPVISHSVHFNEGMTVRNFIREFYDTNNLDLLDCHFLDNNWEQAVIDCF